MSIGAFFWFVGGILMVIAAIILGTHSTSMFILLGVACGFFGIAFSGVALPAIVRQAPPAA